MLHLLLLCDTAVLVLLLLLLCRLRQGVHCPLLHLHWLLWYLYLHFCWQLLLLLLLLLLCRLLLMSEPIRHRGWQRVRLRLDTPL